MVYFSREESLMQIRRPLHHVAITRFWNTLLWHLHSKGRGERRDTHVASAREPLIRTLLLTPIQLQERLEKEKEQLEYLMSTVA